MESEKRTILSHETKFDDTSRSTPVGQTGASSRTTGLMSDADNSSAQHKLFCKMIGIPDDYDTDRFPSIWNLFSRQKTRKGLYPRVRKAYQWHTFQYWFVATLSNALLWLQICFGAALTALGGTKSDKVSIAIVVLGALQTIFGGLITYFKSRNQPNRARQFRIGLKRVLDAIENSEAMLRDGSFVPPPYTPRLNGEMLNNAAAGWFSGSEGIVVQGVDGMVLRLMDMYMDTVREAENNYPDYWLSKTSDGDPVPWMIMRDVLKDAKDRGNLQGPVPEASGSGTPQHATAGSTKVKTNVNENPALGSKNNAGLLPGGDALV